MICVLLVSSGGLLVLDLALQSSYGELSSQYGILQTHAAALQTEADNYLREIQEAHKNFASLLGTIEMRSPMTGDETKQFITLDDAAVKTLVSQVTGGWDGTDSDMWSDINDMTTWVTWQIGYSYDTYIPVISGSLESGLQISWGEDFWRFPNETIRDRHGDCEDEAILLTTMIRCYFKYCVGVMYPTYAMVLAGSSSAGHVAVVIPVAGGKIVILDPAGYFTTNWSKTESTADAMAEFFSHWSNGFDHVHFVFNDAAYQNFATLSDFISWINVQQ